MTKPASTLITLPVIVAGALLLASTAAHAVPVELAFSGTVSSSTVPGVSSGDAITYDVFADNGGASLILQTWSFNDITSATMQAGTYSATTSGPQTTFPGALPGSGSFSTNASAQLRTLNFRSEQNGSDTNGNSSFIYYMNGFNNIWYTNPPMTVPSFGAISPPSITNTTISVVPLPAALPLFASGIGGLGLLGWRRKRKACAGVA
jgi:hypothetical protein